VSPLAVRRALILADGAIPQRAHLDAAWPDWAEGVDLVLAADGGARHAATLGVRVQGWVGDGDSIDPGELTALAEAGVDVRRSPVDKDESDTELALLAAVEAGARSVAILGALGGMRIDHALSNVALLEHPALAGREAWLYDEHAVRISLIAADGREVSRKLEGRAGDLVSFVPLGTTAQGVTTEGLRYPLAGEALVLGRTRGVSNVRTGPVARITLESGRLLVIETPATVRP
jgi:thiamine pyrophosphokinase